MKVIISGTGRGIGKAIAEKFLSTGNEVVGLDILPAALSHPLYRHIVCDITKDLPQIDGAEILINNAGAQDSGRDIEINLNGTIAVTEKYAFGEKIKSVLFIASASARTGAEFPMYAASKGGVVAYMKNIALRLGASGVTVNSLSPGGVLTQSNDRVINNPTAWQKIMNQTLMEKWATVEEIAEWAYFLTTVNKSMTAQDILIDNGENAKSEFVW